MVLSMVVRGGKARAVSSDRRLKPFAQGRRFFRRRRVTLDCDLRFAVTCRYPRHLHDRSHTGARASVRLNRAAAFANTS